MAQIGIIKIKQLTDALIEFIKTDYDESVVAGTESESFLLRCFDDQDQDGGVNYIDLAKSIFGRDQKEQRKLETRIMFDKERAALPTIHVREPAKGKGDYDGIGYIGEEYITNADDSFHETKRRSFKSQYELMITSSNRHEVIVIEEVMLAALIGAQDTLSLNTPFYRFDFNVKELMANNELIPNPLFIKAIGIDTSYEKSYPSIIKETALIGILFERHILES